MRIISGMYHNNLCILLIFVISSKDAFRVERLVQSVAVRGQFVCGHEPAIGARIKLFEHDKNFPNGFSNAIEIGEYLKIPNHDDVLNETYTDREGYFFLHGTAVEANQIEPIVKVYHKCSLNGLLVMRKIHFRIPPHFTNYGKYAEKVLDLGIFNLEVILPDEQLEFIVSR